MKIAFFHNLPPGGAKRVVYEEIKYLSKRHTIELFQLTSDTEDFLNFHNLRCKTHTYHFHIASTLPGILNRISKDIQNFIILKHLHKNIAKVIDSKRFDIVIIHPDKYTQAPFILRYLKTKKVYYCHELLRIAYEDILSIPKDLPLVKKRYEIFTRNIRKNIDRLNAQKSDIIITNSKFTQQNIKRFYKTNAFVCYQGVDIRVFHPDAKKTKKNSLLFIGESIPINGSKLLDQIRTSLSRQEITLKIIDFFNTEKTHKLTDKELAFEYSQSLATLCLSYNEPFGLAAIESMACGTPVIAINEGGYKETVVNNKTGYLIPRSKRALIQKITALRTDKHLYEKLSKQCQNEIRQKWTWEKHASSLEDYLVDSKRLVKH